MVSISTGAELWVDVVGAGPPVVLVHSNFGSHKIWEPQIRPLSKNVTVVAYDVRGFGSSPLAPGRHSDHADLRALIDALELRAPHLVGISMGAGIVWDFALAYPKIARSLVVVPGGMAGDAMAPWMEAMWPRIESAIEAGDHRRASELVMDVDLPPLRSLRLHPDVERRVARIIDEHPWAAWSAKWQAYNGLEPPAYGRISELDLPVLAISGALDAPEFRAEAEYIAREAPRAEFFVIENAGHYVNMEAPAEFNEAVVRFLDTVEGSAAPVDSPRDVAVDGRA